MSKNHFWRFYWFDLTAIIGVWAILVIIGLFGSSIHSSMLRALLAIAVSGLLSYLLFRPIATIAFHISEQHHWPRIIVILGVALTGAAPMTFIIWWITQLGDASAITAMPTLSQYLSLYWKIAIGGFIITALFWWMSLRGSKKSNE